MNTALSPLIESGTLISAAVFMAAVSLFLVGVLVFVPAMQTRRRIAQTLIADAPVARPPETKAPGRRDTASSVEAYFKAVEKERATPNALEAKLFRAGFHQPNAVALYNVARIACVLVGFLAAYAALAALLPPGLSGWLSLAGAVVFGLACIVIPSIMLDRFENAEKQIYRRGFPDFMDMMITCADAGMSLEAAVERVSSEFGETHKSLGIQLSIMTLQMRAGKPMRDALRELSDRIGIEEAKSLAVLFRQSEELGTSLNDALRVYSDEMRSRRILRAEERANALPVKMMIPLGLCIFPVVMMIIMLPVIIRMRGIFF